MDTVIAVVVSLAAAVLFGLSDVVEQDTTHKVPERRALSPRLLLDLAKRRVWLAAIGVNILGNILQVVALHSARWPSSSRSWSATCCSPRSSPWS